MTIQKKILIGAILIGIVAIVNEVQTRKIHHDMDLVMDAQQKIGLAVKLPSTEQEARALALAVKVKVLADPSVGAEAVVILGYLWEYFRV